MKIFRDNTKAKSGVKSWCVKMDDGTKKMFATRDEAKAYSLDKDYEIKNGMHISSARSVSVYAAVNDFIRRLEDIQKSEREIAHRICVMKRFQDRYTEYTSDGEFNSSKKVHSIDVFELENYIKWLANEHGNSYKTIQNHIQVIKIFFIHCLKKKWVNENPVNNLILTDIITQEAKDDLAVKLGHNVVGAILAAADNLEAKTCIEFACFTGLRASEQRALQWKDISFEEDKVYVYKKADNKNRVVNSTKSKAGKRDVDIEPNLLNSLLDWRGMTKFSKDDDFVFPSDDGSVADTGRYRRQFLYNAIKKAGVDKIRWHDLRHYFASILLEHFQDQLWTVTEKMGHASINTTHSIYSHWFEDADRDAKIKAKFNQIRKI